MAVLNSMRVIMQEGMPGDDRRSLGRFSRRMFSGSRAACNDRSAGRNVGVADRWWCPALYYCTPRTWWSIWVVFTVSNFQNRNHAWDYVRATTNKTMHSRSYNNNRSMHAVCIKTSSEPFIFITFHLIFLFFMRPNYRCRHSQARAHTHPYKRTHVHPTPISTFEELSWTDKSRDWRSHHRRLTVNGHVIYHWKNSAIKFWNKSRKIRAPMSSRGLKLGWAGSTIRNLSS
jgi:hypothetical protein